MDNNDFADLAVQISAIERMLVWLAGREVMRGGDASHGIRTMADELHEVLDGTPHADNPGVARLIEATKSRLDHLVASVAHEVNLAEGRPQSS